MSTLLLFAVSLCVVVSVSCSLPRPRRMVARGKPQPDPHMAEMYNNLQVKICYFNTAHSKFEMLLTIFVASTEFFSFYTFVRLSQEPFTSYT